MRKEREWKDYETCGNEQVAVTGREEFKDEVLETAGGSIQLISRWSGFGRQGAGESERKTDANMFSTDK